MYSGRCATGVLDLESRRRFLLCSLCRRPSLQDDGRERTLDSLWDLQLSSLKRRWVKSATLINQVVFHSLSSGVVCISVW